MQLANYRFDDGIGPGLVTDAGIADLRHLACSVRALLGRAGLSPGPVHPLDPARLLPPIPDPASFIGVGLNYRDHAAEVGRLIPEQPPLFAKLPASLAAPQGETPWPGASFDYEGELGVVIGRAAYRVKAADAMAHVAGYVVVNDLTVRDLARPDTLLLAKNGPGFAPFGPWLTTADEVPDPHALTLRTWVNGELRQHSSTAELHHRIPALIAYVSQAIPLAPGDVITTGSPHGSGIGMQPPRFLAPGDVVRVEIKGLGAIETRIGPPLPDASPA